MPKTIKVEQHRARDLKEIIAQIEKEFPNEIQKGVVDYLKAKGFKELQSDTPLLVIYVGNVKLASYDITLIEDNLSDADKVATTEEEGK